AASQSTSNSQSQASADQAASQAASATTAVLGTNQTLYNFAVTHGTTPTQLYALNPGVTSQNYSNFAGQSLRIK
ncbi:LysM peptidoglycan-binding domain-containing protein, partial [Fructobacillus ficulneus]